MILHNGNYVVCEKSKHGMHMVEEKTNNESLSVESTAEHIEIGYSVFYGDSEEIAKALAISHIQNCSTKNQVQIERPNISAKQIILGILFPILLTLASILYGTLDAWYPWWALVATVVLVILLFIKRFVVLLVLLYQRFAPERIRASCVFEPTCSNYMLMAIDKYGFWIGLFKGIARLFKCHHPNGGKDYP